MSLAWLIGVPIRGKGGNERSRVVPVHINPFVYGGEPVGRWIISHNRIDSLMQFLL
jgi:hypothetical protein